MEPFEDSDFDQETETSIEATPQAEPASNTRSLEARRLIEQRMELKRLRELLDDPSSNDPLEF